MPLILSNVGEENVIKKIYGKEDIKRHLENLGFVTGSVVTVVSEMAGNLIVSVKGTRIALSKEMAKNIMI